MQPPYLILASASPQRRDILLRLGLPFTSVAPEPDDPPESITHTSPEGLADELALAKAQSVASQGHTGLIVAADTLVVLDRQLLGKPKDPDDATRMLRDLRGRVHRVITGIAIVDTASGRHFTGYEVTQMKMRQYTDDEILAYVATGEPMDKAGACAIQDTTFRPVESIQGCYWNVVGLPVCRLLEMLGSWGLPTPRPPADLIRECPGCVLEE